MAVTVVNVIPAAFSGETQRDSEPNIAVDPSNPQRIAASAFTPHPAGTGAGPGPIFISTDGGTTWNQNNVLPGGDRTFDVTVQLCDLVGNSLCGDHPSRQLEPRDPALGRFHRHGPDDGFGGPALATISPTSRP